VDAEKVKEIRAMTGLSQTKFARVLDVDFGTLRNWNRVGASRLGRRGARLRAIQRYPKAVLKALAA
jgi:putative transcriptional regulator